MPRKTTANKPGRPRRQPLDIEVERHKVREGMRKTAKRQLGIEDVDINEFREQVHGVTSKHKFTRAEMDELRRRMDVLYTEFVTEQHERQAEEERELNAKLKQEALLSKEPVRDNAISREEWNLLHGLRPDGKKKPGPKPKKKKTIFDVELEAGEPIDIEAMEKQFLDQKIKEAAAEPQPLKGRRVAKDGWALRDAQLKREQQRQQHWR